MNASIPQISVIVPVFNLGAFVGPCLSSLKAQTLADFEAIVIDDGSTDDSRQRISDAIAGDTRFRVFAGPNGGLSAARNIGLALARGRYIAFLDGDDRFAPVFLERMLAALEASGADWVACGLAYVPTGKDEGPTHSAIHRAPVLDPAAGPRLHDLSDWREVVQHFPSAWNKLYRAELIRDLRFDVGTYYEDHAFFWQAAARTRAILHLPEALYLNTTGRAGQITRDGGERVFEQFAVLDRLHKILDGVSDRSGRAEAMAEIALRLVRERGQVIADPPRLGRFARQAQEYLDALGGDWRAGLEASAPLSRFDRALLGRRALCVIIPSEGSFAPLVASLESLAAQRLRDFDILVVSDGAASVADLARAAEAAGMARRVTILGPDVRDAMVDTDAAARVAQARNRGLAAGAADFVVFLDAGDALRPNALELWLDAMIASGADLGFSAFHIASPDGARHGGVHDEMALAGAGDRLAPEAALALHALPSAKIFRRAHLLDSEIRFPAHPLQSWEVALRAAATGRSLRLPGAEVVQGDTASARQFWRGPAPKPEVLAASVLAIAGALPEGWDTADIRLRLLTRALWEKLNFAAYQDGTEKVAWNLSARAAWRAWAAEVAVPLDGLDPYVAPAFRDFLMQGAPAR